MEMKTHLPLSTVAPGPAPGTVGREGSLVDGGDKGTFCYRTGSQAAGGGPPRV